MSDKKRAPSEKSGPLSRQTQEYYDGLIPSLGEDYIHFRWKRGPVQRSHYRHTRATVERIFEDHIGFVPRLLEVGCGPGTWTDLCIEHSEETVLLDISAEMLARARERFGQDETVQYVCEDFGADKRSDLELFDTIFSARALEYMDDKARVVRKCRHLLRPGGHLVIVTKNPRWLDKILDERAKKRAEPNPRSQESGIQTGWIYWADLDRVLSDHGFDVISINPVAIGSYRPWLANRVGVVFADMLFRILGRREMSPLLDPLSESYVVVARAQRDATS